MRPFVVCSPRAAMRVGCKTGELNCGRGSSRQQKCDTGIKKLIHNRSPIRYFIDRDGCSECCKLGRRQSASAGRVRSLEVACRLYGHFYSSVTCVTVKFLLVDHGNPPALVHRPGVLATVPMSFSKGFVILVRNGYFCTHT